MAKHWYTREGNPKYRIVGKNGKERDTNLADARKLNLLYSVTEVIGKIAKPALVQWQLKQLLEAVVVSDLPVPDQIPIVSIKNPHDILINKQYNEWALQVLEQYKTGTGVYAKEGNVIHDALEKYYKTGEVHPDDEWFVYKVVDKVSKLNYTKYQAEKSFASPLGYGGKIDLILGDNEALLDFKSKRGDQLGKQNLRDDYVMQLAAYREAINPKAKCYNCIISSTHESEIYIHEWSKEELDRGWEMFKNLLEYTKLVNKYDSGF